MIQTLRTTIILLLIMLLKQFSVAQDVKIDKFSAYTSGNSSSDGPSNTINSGGSFPSNGGSALKVPVTGSIIKVQLILRRPSYSSDEVGVALYVSDWVNRPKEGSPVRGYLYTANGDDNTIITSNSGQNGAWLLQQPSSYYTLNLTNNPLFTFTVNHTTPGASTQTNANTALYAVTYNITTRKILEVSGWIPMSFFTPPFAPAPGIGNIVPNGALPGKPIKIYGIGFKNAMEVIYPGGTVALSGFKIVDDGEINMNVPTRCLSGPIVIKNTSNQYSKGYNFTVFNPTTPPVLTLFYADLPGYGITVRNPLLVPNYKISLNIAVNGPSLLDYNVSAIDFNGVIVKEFSITSDFSLTVKVPVNVTPGLVSIVTKSLGNSNGLPYIFPRPQNACNQVVCGDQYVAYGGTPTTLLGRLIADSYRVDFRLYNWLVSNNYFNEPVFDDGSTLEHVQWQSSPNNKDWYDIPSATDRDYQPDPCYQTTYYRRISTHLIKSFWTSWRGEWYKSNVITIIPSVSVASGLYKIHNRRTGQVLEIGGGGSATIADGATANQWPYVGTANQEWNITAISTGGYKIVNRNSQQALEIGGSDWNMLQPGSVAHQWTDWAENGGKNQQWAFQPVDGAPSYYTITNANSGQVLEIGGGVTVNTQAGALANQWPYGGKDSYEQQWQLVPVTVQTSTRFPGVYTIKNVNSQKLLEIGGASTDNGATANQSSNAETANQQWTFVETTKEHYKIINRNSGLALEIAGASIANTAPVQQGIQNTSKNQQWTVGEVSPGVYKIINDNSTLALEIAYGSTSNDAGATQYLYADVPHHHWILTQIGQNRLAVPEVADTNHKSKAVQLLQSGAYNQLEGTRRLLIFPNPASTVLNFRSSGTTKFNLIKITNMLGAVILSRRYPTSNQIDISSLTTGIYWLTVSDGKQVYQQKFIKK